MSQSNRLFEISKSRHQAVNSSVSLKHAASSGGASAPHRPRWIRFTDLYSGTIIYGAYALCIHVVEWSIHSAVGLIGLGGGGRAQTLCEGEGSLLMYFFFLQIISPYVFYFFPSKLHQYIATPQECISLTYLDPPPPCVCMWPNFASWYF